ncbi:MAG: hypothetical protein AAFZ63_26175 [Bacteroidota bacterium]
MSKSPAWHTYVKLNRKTDYNQRYFLERSDNLLIVTDKVIPLTKWFGPRQTTSREYILVAKMVWIPKPLRLRYNKNAAPISFRLLPPKSLPLQRWMMYQQMPKAFVEENFAAPDTIVETAAGAEKWFYPNDVALVFSNDQLIKVRENYRLHQNYSLVWPGMSKDAVSEVLGTPDRGTSRDQIWYYGLEAEVVFQDDQVQEVRLLDAALEMANMAAEKAETELNLRDKVLPFLDKGSWYEQDAEAVDAFFKEVAAAGPGGPAAKVVGAFTRSQAPAISYPLLASMVTYLQTTPPTIEQLAKAVDALELSMDDVRQNTKLREEVLNFTMERPVLLQDKQLLLLEAKARRKTGEIINNRQAVFLRGRRLYAIQLSFLSGQANNGLEDFQRIIEEIEL